MKRYLLSLTAMISVSAFAANPSDPAFSALEKTFDGKIGVYAVDTNTNQVIDYRSNERFPMQSTYKFMGSAALLHAAAAKQINLNERIHYTKADLYSWQPITSQHLDTGMTLGELAAAATADSDTPAMNLISKRMGGPQFAATFAHSIGNASFNASHYEGSLNSDPNNPDDTVTPKDMALSLKKLLLGSELPPAYRSNLLSWMRNCTTGYQRIRAGTPNGFTVADKTGSGDYGVANDVGMLWSSTCKPIILAIYTVQNKSDATRRDDILASTTKMVMDSFAKTDPCFKAMMGA